eukprot:UN05899
MPRNEPAFLAKVPSGHKLRDVEGPRSQDAIDQANDELNGMVKVFEKHNVEVLRPDIIDWNTEIKTPTWSVPYGNTTAMPRDVLLPVGNEIIETTMSWRSRFFDYLPYRTILNNLFEKDENFIWSAMPKPTMNDSMYNHDYEIHNEERAKKAADRIYVTKESEPVMDAADCMKMGKDIFVNNSFVTNRKGYDWLRRQLNPKGFRVHFVDFPEDLFPMHVDTNLVPLRPYTCLVNPVRPPRDWVQNLFQDNGWKFIVGTNNNLPVPPLSQCSAWLRLIC